MTTLRFPSLGHISATIALVGLLAGCGDKAPKGQVVAVVDGEEVTRREIAAEPQTISLPQGDDAQPALAAVLSGVIDRKLATAEAQRLNLDHTPQYIAQAARVKEVMLSRTLFDRWAAEIPPPNKRAVADQIAQNPQSFAGRKLLLVDRIETTADKSQSEALAPLQTNDAIAAYLDSRSQPYQRARTVIDTATLPLPLYRQLLSQPPGYPLAIVQNEGLVALAVIETRDAPPSASAAEEQAGKALTQAAVRDKLSALRKQAKITYQPGYRPLPAPSSAAAPKDVRAIK